MAQINVTGLTFCYEGSFDNIFEDVSFSIDTDWKLGFTGRNGKGKTTFLNLLLGKYEYRGNIQASTVFEYFPFDVSKELMKQNTLEVVEQMDSSFELWRICMELEQLKMSAQVLYRPYNTLSHGEQTKVMLAVLFAKEQHFLLIDEPTNHLDMEARALLAEYLKKKKGFILVSHDRWFLDQCVDHMLVLNRSTISVEKGNFSSWWENKQRQDSFELSEHEKLKKEITKLTAAAKRTAAWADKVEATKIGFDPQKEPERFIGTRSYIGAKSKKLQSRSLAIQQRSTAAINEKKELLKDLEMVSALKLMPLEHYKEVYVECRSYSCGYAAETVLNCCSFKVQRGDRLLLKGKNGCGKSTLLKRILRAEGSRVCNRPDNMDVDCPLSFWETGCLETASGLLISYIDQDTSFLCGSLDAYIEKCGLDESVFKAVLRQLDFERVQFVKNMEDYSEGQRKKVLIAASLLCQAHLYIWDEPLNYVDVISRMQIETLLKQFQPTMLFVEHDKQFAEAIATRCVIL